MVLVMSIGVLSGCTKTAYVDSKNVVEAKNMASDLNKDNVIVIDARSGADYKKGHLKGAIHLDAAALTVSEPVKATLAPKEQVEAVLGEAGISAEDTVYIYDNNGGVSAGRIWWTLRMYGHKNVKVVNGGQEAIGELIGDGTLQASGEATKLETTTYAAGALNDSMLATIEDIKNLSEDTLLLDVRSQAEFEEGTIPEAVLYSHKNNLYKDGTFKSKRTTYLEYNKLGVKKDDPIILFCKSSYRATQTALLLEDAGYTNVKVYDGAWLEYSTLGLPVQGSSTQVITVQDAS